MLTRTLSAGKCGELRLIRDLGGRGRSGRNVPKIRFELGRIGTFVTHLCVAILYRESK